MFPKLMNHLHQLYYGSDCNELDMYDEANHLLSIFEKPPEERFDAQPNATIVNRSLLALFCIFVYML